MCWRLPRVQGERDRDLRGCYDIHTNLIVSKHVKYLHRKRSPSLTGTAWLPARDIQPVQLMSHPQATFTLKVYKCKVHHVA